MGLFGVKYQTAEEFANALDYAISTHKYKEENKMGKFIEKQAKNILNRPKGFRAQDISIFESYFILENVIQPKSLNEKINRLYLNLMRHFVDYLKGEGEIKYIRFVFEKEKPFYSCFLAVKKEDEEERSKAALLHLFDRLYHDDLEDAEEYLEAAKLHCHPEYIEVFENIIGEKARLLKIDNSKKTNALRHKDRINGLSEKINSIAVSEAYVVDCINKAKQALNDGDYFQTAYYLHQCGSSEDVLYRDVAEKCYHPSGATGYSYVESVLTKKSLGNITEDEIKICAFILDKFVPKGTKNSKNYRAWCYYRLGEDCKAAGMISHRGLMFYDGRIQDVSEIVVGESFTKITPYSDEIMASNLLNKLFDALDIDSNPSWVNYLRGNDRLKEKVLIAEAYVKLAKNERFQYRLTEIEEDVITLKSVL